MTQIIRISLVDDTAALDERIINECDVRTVAGYWLSGCFVSGDQLVLIFQER